MAKQVSNEVRDLCYLAGYLKAIADMDRAYEQPDKAPRDKLVSLALPGHANEQQLAEHMAQGAVDVGKTFRTVAGRIEYFQRLEYLLTR